MERPALGRDLAVPGDADRGRHPYLLQAVAARPGWRVCDIGCGGRAADHRDRRSRGARGRSRRLRHLGAAARTRPDRAADAGCANVRFVEMDVQTGTGDHGPFDLAVSQFGVMFFDEPTAAFAAIRDHLTPAGRFVFACWQGVERNPWHLGTALRRSCRRPGAGAGEEPGRAVRLR